MSNKNAKPYTMAELVTDTQAYGAADETRIHPTVAALEEARVEVAAKVALAAGFEELANIRERERDEARAQVKTLTVVLALAVRPDIHEAVKRRASAAEARAERLAKALELMTPAPGFPKCDSRCSSNSHAYDEDNRCDCGMEEIRANAEQVRAALNSTGGQK